VQPDIFDADAGELVGQFDFLGVEDRHVFEFAAIGEAQVNTLAARRSGVPSPPAFNFSPTT
jgi:hypothetical protein